MINKDNEIENNELTENEPVDVIDLDIQCHILIKDKDTNEILLNKRG